MKHPDQSGLATTTFRLHPRQRALLHNGKPVKVGARAMEILIALAERPGELVSKNELLERVWPNQQIEEAALRVHLSALRRLLGTDAQERPLIVNENGRGYRLIVDLSDKKRSQRSDVQLRPDFPRPLASIIGRDEMIEDVARLATSKRHLTLCGPGGVGKTTIALAAALEISEMRELTPVFVDLTQLEDGEPIANLLVELIGEEIPVAEAAEQVANLLCERDYLVVFDTCEHMIDRVAETVEALLRGAPNLSIIATSREPLRTEGEWLLRIPPLDLPASSGDAEIETVLRASAARLFLDRARGQDSCWRLGKEDVAALVRICCRLDGLPLAIEMAAAKLPSMSLLEIDRMSADLYPALASIRRTALPRHRTLQTVFDWSFDLLSVEEKRLLTALCVFEAGFDLDAARLAVGKLVASSTALQDLLAALVAKSLLIAEPGRGSTQYRMLQTIRAHAATKLATDIFAETVQTASRQSASAAITGGSRNDAMPR